MRNPSSQFLESTDIVDWRHDSVVQLAAQLADQSKGVVETARRCFEWVRDDIRHSSDHKLNPVTCSASEVLSHGTGYCYAKSHLLAALLRANEIPAGFCYQRLSIEGTGPPFCLHGFNAVYLPDVDWYRIDARGNRDDLEAVFCPPSERLPFSTQLPGEKNFPEILHAPLQIVVDCLHSHSTWDAVSANLPDAEDVE